MIFARRTNECGILRERVSASNCSRSCSANTTAALGLPIAHPPFPRLHEASELIKLLMGQNRSSNGLFYGTEQIFKDLQIIFAGQDTSAILRTSDSGRHVVGKVRRGFARLLQRAAKGRYHALDRAGK